MFAAKINRKLNSDYMNTLPITTKSIDSIDGIDRIERLAEQGLDFVCTCEISDGRCISAVTMCYDGLRTGLTRKRL